MQQPQHRRALRSVALAVAALAGGAAQAADFTLRSKHFGLYRVHDGPTVDKLANLRTFPWIRMKENKREIALHGVWFDISLGELHAYDEDAAEWGAVKG